MPDESSTPLVPSVLPPGARGELPRRALLHAAWVAPVILAAVAAPAAAASGSLIVTLSILQPENSGFPLVGMVTAPDLAGVETAYDLQVRNKTTLIWTSYATGTTNSDGNMYQWIPYSLADAHDQLRLQAGVAPDLSLSAPIGIWVPSPPSVSLALHLEAGLFVVAETNVFSWQAMPLVCQVSYQAHSPVSDTWTEVATATTNASGYATPNPAIEKANLAGYDTLRAVANPGYGASGASEPHTIP